MGTSPVTLHSAVPSDEHSAWVIETALLPHENGAGCAVSFPWQWLSAGDSDDLDLVDVSRPGAGV